MRSLSGSSHLQRGVRPSKGNLKAVAKFAPPQTYTEIWAFLGWMGHIWWFIKGLTCIGQPLHKHLSGEGASKKSEWVTLMVEAKDAFGTLKKVGLEAPMLAFAIFDKPFLLETNASRLGLRAVLCQKKTDSEYHLVAYASQSLTFHEHNYHSMKWVFGTKVGNCRAVSGIPTLKTIHCQGQQQSVHLHHDYT